MPPKSARKRPAKAVAPLAKRKASVAKPMKIKSAPRSSTPLASTAAPKVGLTFDAVFEPQISRLFIFRFLWAFIEMWVFIVWGIWIAILRFLHFWYMLILGQRSLTLWKKELRFFRHLAKWQAYWAYLVNVRPDFISKEE